MEVATIKDDEVLLIYHPADEAADVGSQYKLVEVGTEGNGLVVQVISNDSLDYMGLQQELIQRVLESRLGQSYHHLDREVGLGEMRSLKIATAKIRKRLVGGCWQRWDGWIPSRNVSVESIPIDELLANAVVLGEFPITFCDVTGVPIGFNGELLNMVNVITGVKGSGKSHTAKHIVLALANLRIPVIVFDINGEYVDLPNVQVLEWGENFRPVLDEVGYSMLLNVIRDVHPLPENSEAVLSAALPRRWAARREYCESRNQRFTMDIPTLQQSATNAPWQTGQGGQYVNEAINSRLETIQSRDLFWDYSSSQGANRVAIATLYDHASGGRPIVFDMRNLSANLQRALVMAMNAILKEICASEARLEHTGPNGRHVPAGQQRFPFVFYEEAHFYVSDDVIIDIITRGRHIGMGAFFVTNTPQELPRTVFRQLDNLFLLSLTHTDDIKNVSNNSFTDEETIRSFATRLPQHHALIVGNVTQRYPLIVEILDLPDGVPASGQTRSTWDRFKDNEPDGG